MQQKNSTNFEWKGRKYTKAKAHSLALKEIRKKLKANPGTKYFIYTSKKNKVSIITEKQKQAYEKKHITRDFTWAQSKLTPTPERTQEIRKAITIAGSTPRLSEQEAQIESEGLASQVVSKPITSTQEAASAYLTVIRQKLRKPMARKTEDLIVGILYQNRQKLKSRFQVETTYTISNGRRVATRTIGLLIESASTLYNLKGRQLGNSKVYEPIEIEIQQLIDEGKCPPQQIEIIGASPTQDKDETITNVTMTIIFI